jgi:hypothetical protein
MAVVEAVAPPQEYPVDLVEVEASDSPEEVQLRL